ncbi:MAG TPA: iron chelate uptake ABC transporter family permease subunit [Acholeplasma sp.]|jgi:manganese/zinc/iron transport system permease protein|nr:iron chelate uptake ABC transporter family permease subunit [Acholeplasma sp.]
MGSWFTENYIFIIIALGTMTLGLVNGAFGVFLVLKKQALVGDALSHATLPGIVLAFMFTQSKNMIVLLVGAAMSALFAMLVLEIIKRFSNIKSDAGLALILSSFFGFGQVLLLIVQTTGDGSQVGINSFIFGQAATMLKSDVIFIIAVSLFVLLVILLFWKELKICIFNSEFSHSLGYKNKIINAIINVLVVIVVTISIKTVGVILMSALLIAPAVASRQFSNKLSINVILAGLIGLLSAFVGTTISSSVTNLPTGPVIVVVLCSLVILALFFSPKTGILFKVIKDKYHKHQIIKYHILIHAYHHGNLVTELNNIDMMINNGYISKEKDKYLLTQKGVCKVEAIIGEENGC